MLLAIVLLPATSHADFSAFGTLQTQFSDNANKTNDDEFDQREDQLIIGLGYEENRSWIDLQADYQATRYNFDTDSPRAQTNRTEYLGETQLHLENATRIIEFDARHERDRLLSNPEELSLQDNFLARDTISLSPVVNILSTQADTLSVFGTYSETRFDQQASGGNGFDSSRSGLGLSWRRSLSEVDQIVLSLQDQDIDYDALESDFGYQRYTLSYIATLRRIDYSFTAGFNAYEDPSGETFNSPLGRITLGYRNGQTSVTADSSFSITDTSLGNQMIGDIADNLSQGSNGNIQFIDQYKLWNTSVTVNTSICNLCTLRTSLTYTEQEYNVRTSEDIEQIILSSDVSYELSTLDSLSFGITYTDLSLQNPSIDSINQAFDSTAVNFEYNRTLSRNINARARFQNEQRNSPDEARNYTENTLLISITYTY
ncbi:hypothetical protein [Marinibactrum halimedae]|uniref:hypothetical protein n=1 Tax=Marinibactrum halimedae TaxID=1444977 RepID=UPI001E43FBBB|nr:hypothetical protein [Marinibactrum halimedae]